MRSLSPQPGRNTLKSHLALATPRQPSSEPLPRISCPRALVAQYWCSSACVGFGFLSNSPNTIQMEFLAISWRLIFRHLCHALPCYPDSLGNIINPVRTQLFGDNLWGYAPFMILNYAVVLWAADLFIRVVSVRLPLGNGHKKGSLRGNRKRFRVHSMLYILSQSISTAKITLTPVHVIIGLGPCLTDSWMLGSRTERISDEERIPVRCPFFRTRSSIHHLPLNSDSTASAQPS